MKKLSIIIAMASIAIFSFSSCTERTKPESNYSAKWSDDGKDSIIHVNYVNETGNENSFFMNYLLFRSLYTNGGYTNVYRYYTLNPTEFQNYAKPYTNYKAKSSSGNYSSASRTSTSITDHSSPSRSYSSPSRSYSSPSNSYSSPSRTYTSPSTNYNSPSRSYSSPSRSYSSPSSH